MPALLSLDRRGWRRAELSAEPEPQLAPIDFETMQETFEYLDQGREALAGLANREATTFEGSPVMKQLKRCKTVEELLAR